MLHFWWAIPAESWKLRRTAIGTTLQGDYTSHRWARRCSLQDVYKPYTFCIRKWSGFETLSLIVSEPPTPDCVFTNLEISFQGRQRNGKVLTTSNLQAERRRQRILNHLAGTNEHAGHFPLEKAPHFDRHCNVWWTSFSPKCARRSSRYTRPGIGSVSSMVWFLVSSRVPGRIHRLWHSILAYSIQ